jgi:hypothetical protein
MTYLPLQGTFIECRMNIVQYHLHACRFNMTNTATVYNSELEILPSPIWYCMLTHSKSMQFLTSFGAGSKRKLWIYTCVAIPSICSVVWAMTLYLRMIYVAMKHHLLCKIKKNTCKLKRENSTLCLVDVLPSWLISAYEFALGLSSYYVNRDGSIWKKNFKYICFLTASVL